MVFGTAVRATAAALAHWSACRLTIIDAGKIIQYVRAGDASGTQSVGRTGPRVVAGELRCAGRYQAPGFLSATGATAGITQVARQALD